MQGDLLYTQADLKKETINGETLYTFRPNTITYAIPTNHPIGVAAKQAKIGVVFHTHITREVMFQKCKQQRVPK